MTAPLATFRAWWLRPEEDRRTGPYAPPLFATLTIRRELQRWKPQKVRMEHWRYLEPGTRLRVTLASSGADMLGITDELDRPFDLKRCQLVLGRPASSIRHQRRTRSPSNIDVRPAAQTCAGGIFRLKTGRV